MSIFRNLWDILGLGTPIDESEYGEADLEESDLQDENWQDGYSSREERSADKVVGMPERRKGQSEVLLAEPRSFEEIPQVVSALKQRKAVILNLSLMDADTAQRCVDFVAGGAFAVDGHQQRIGEAIFLFTPNVVQISNVSADKLNPVPVEYPVAPRRPTTPASVWTGQGSRMVQ